MSESLLLITVIAIVALSMYGIVRADSRRRRMSRVRQAFATESPGFKSNEQLLNETDAGAAALTAEAATRSLIGDEAYDRMSANVDRILSMHRAERSANVMLTTGPDTPQGSAELHRLLPGDPVWLRRSCDNGLDVVDVYSGGFRIGRLMLSDAVRVIDIMQSAVITGTYVAEQNCWGDSAEISLGIIIFHSTPEEYRARLGRDPISAPYRITIDGPQRIVLYQN